MQVGKGQQHNKKLLNMLQTDMIYSLNYKIFMKHGKKIFHNTQLF